MTIFDDDNESFKSAGAGFHFSGIGINDLEASEFTLFGLGVDFSGSVSPFAQEIEACVKRSLESCQRSPRVDNLLVRIVSFNDRVVEQHGWRPLAECHLNKYTGFVKTGGTTALLDATVSLLDSATTYAEALHKKGYTSNAIVTILTDGVDVGSTLGMNDVKEAMRRATTCEYLESIVTILIGINVQDASISQRLKEFKDKAGFREYIEVQDASPKALAKVAGYLEVRIKPVHGAQYGLGERPHPILGKNGPVGIESGS